MKSLTNNTMQNIKLRENYLAVKFLEENKTTSGIIIADTADIKPQRGEITHVGGEQDEFQVGQTILFEKYGAIEVKIGLDTIHIIDKRDVIGFIE